MVYLIKMCIIPIRVETFLQLIDVSLVIMLVILSIEVVHGARSIVLMLENLDIAALFSYVYGAIIPSIFAVIDGTLAMLGIISLSYKVKYLRQQHLKSKEMTVYLRVIIASVICSLLIGLACATSVIVQKPIHGSFEASFLKALKNYSNPQSKAVLDHVQKEHSCCGLKDYKDWFNGKNKTNYMLPGSCCKNVEVPCSFHPDKNASFDFYAFWPTGCLNKYKKALSEYMKLIYQALVVMCCQIMYSIFDRLIQSSMDQIPTNGVHQCYIISKNQIRFGRAKRKRASTTQTPENEN
ncbi:tetraspanin-3-like [Cimex lectularius]|uniref:Tetraspanin n=1 Tax=Cimex lectularius TaxID=79782 RepID=A0A8I6RGN0_CIMLE|nr:tetraspanin-3-like [Cimex lectularius]